MACSADVAENFSSVYTQYPVDLSMLALQHYLPICSIFQFFLPLTGSAICGRAGSHKSAPTRFAAGTAPLHKMVLLLFQKLVQLHRMQFHSVDQNLYCMESERVLKQVF